MIGQLLGALVAAISYDLLARPRTEEPAQGAQGDIVGRRPSARGAPAQRDSATQGRRQGRGGVRTDRRG